MGQSTTWVLRGLILAMTAVVTGCAAPPVAAIPLGSLGLPQAAATSAMQPTVMLTVPDVRQSTDYTCGPSSLQAVLAYWGIEVREDEIAKAAHATPADGSTRFALVKAARGYGVTATLVQPMGIPALEAAVRKGLPVIVAIQAWKDEPGVDYATDWDDGHYVVVIGFDKDHIYVEDPSILGSKGVMTRTEFLARWHDEDTGPSDHYEQLGIVVEGKAHRPLPAFLHVD